MDRIKIPKVAAYILAGLLLDTYGLSVSTQLHLEQVSFLLAIFLYASSPLILVAS